MSINTAVEIQSLLETGAYSADTVRKLEKYVEGQMAGTSPYHYDANRTLAKLYQFIPDLANPAMLARILTLSVLQFPKTDYLALSCLIPETTQESEPIATVVR